MFKFGGVDKKEFKMLKDFMLAKENFFKIRNFAPDAEEEDEDQKTLAKKKGTSSAAERYRWGVLVSDIVRRLLIEDGVLGTGPDFFERWCVRRLSRSLSVSFAFTRVDPEHVLRVLRECCGHLEEAQRALSDDPVQQQLLPSVHICGPERPVRRLCRHAH